MIDQSLRIGDLIEVGPVQTVIRLEEGRTRPQSIAQSFVFTEEVSAHFAVLTDALLKDRGRGFFLQGDFGSGKSHFLAVLSTWLSDRPGADILSEKHSGLRRAKASGRNILPVDISLLNYRATTPLERIVVKAIEAALMARDILTQLTPLAAFLDHFKILLKTDKLAEAFSRQLDKTPEELDAYFSEQPRRCYVEGVRFMQEHDLKAPEVLVEERYETFERAIHTVLQAGFDGLVLIIDELSEFFQSKPDARGLNEDARTLQLLGEVAGTKPIWILAAVQESIERTGDIAQATFRKIKDRFAVKFTLSTVHIKALISQRLVQRRSGADKELYGIFEYLRQQFPSISWSFGDFQATYPVHPATISLLEGLGDLFSQHRGIVDFVHSRLVGDENRHIMGIMAQPSFQLLGPDSIYEHFHQRMAEFSAFYVYVKHIVPHLDSGIEEIIEDPDDRTLARRIVRVLVLYNIHPTASLPTARELTELVSCALSDLDPELNIQFVTETLLDPLVQESMFLVKHPADTGNPLDAVYEVLTQQDPTKTLKAKIARRANDIPPDDTRLLLEPFSELPESASWPGTAILQEGLYRLVYWRQSSRHAFISILAAGEESVLQDRINQALSSAACDFAVVISPAKTTFACNHSAVWQLTPSANRDEISTLREYLAARQIAAELRPTNPAEAPLIQPANERVERLKPIALQAALHVLYAGNFTESAITTEPVIRQMMRFERLLETAGAFLLENRYPGYREIAPRKIIPSRLLYQRLIDEFISPGKLSLKEAHARELSDAIEGLAAPLGLVDLRAGSYFFSPDPENHALLSELFSLLNAAGPTPMADVLQALGSGRYGVPTEVALFLFSALAHGGLISLLKNSRPLPLELLRLNRVETADALAPGDVIGKDDRETLINQCTFLSPTGGWETFGLRQQREAWQQIIKFREWAQNATGDIEKRMQMVAEFSALAAFNLDALRSNVEALKILSSEIKVSYSAREGLERFLKAWRDTNCTSPDIEFVKKMRGFLNREVEQFVFVNHYARHTAIERTTAEDPPIKALHREVLRMLERPEVLVRDQDFAALAHAFERFRTAYAQAYADCHADHYRLFEKKPLSKFAKRALVLLKQLGSVEVLDRPAGITEFFRQIEVPRGAVCKRNLTEEMMRAPVCSCGFVPGETAKPARETAPQDPIEKYLDKYLTLLKGPEIKEALSARIFALRDAEPAIAERLRSLRSVLEDERTSSASLLDVFDAAVTGELSRALTGRVLIEKRSLKGLVSQLGGRRLTPQQVRETVEQWVANPADNTVIAVQEDDLTTGSGRAAATWWALMHHQLFRRVSPLDLADLETTLEQHFPAAGLQDKLARLDDLSLVDFMVTEPFHTNALRTGWLLLTERIVTGSPWPEPAGAESRHSNPEIAAKIRQRLAALQRISAIKGAIFPDALRVRIPLSEILTDPWASPHLRTLVHQIIQRAGRTGQEWLNALPAVVPVNLAHTPTVVILDGVSPDVWLETLAQGTINVTGTQFFWQRLEVAPTTAVSISSIFGFAGDPLDEFHARGIAYHQIKGNEAHGMADLLPEFTPHKPTVIRVSLVDEAAHHALLRLAEMPGAICGFLEKELPRLQELCLKNKRRLIITTDHGLSLTGTGLTHGKGGVYEKALFRVEWPFEDA